MDSRRDHLKILGAVGATLPLAGELRAQHQHDGPAYHAPTVPPFAPKYFNTVEGLAIVRLSDLIIPRTDTPGASDSGVPQFIDAAASQSPERGKILREGIALLEKQAQDRHSKKFLDLAESEQIALLQPLSDAADQGRNTEDGVEFFRILKGLVIDGYYTSYAGLVQELDYKGNRALKSFPGCTHEHGSNNA